MDILNYCHVSLKKSKAVIIYFLLFLFPIFAIAQHGYKLVSVDSLKMEIAQAEENAIDFEEEATLRFSLGVQYMMTRDYENELQCYFDLKRRAKEEKHDSIYFGAMDSEGYIYYRKKNYEACDSVYGLIKSAENVPDLIMGSAYYMPAFLEEEMGRYEIAKNNLDTAFHYYKLANDSIKMPLTLRTLGKIALSYGKPADALKHYQKAITYYHPNSPQYPLVINFYNSIINVYYSHQNYEQALSYSQKIMDMIDLVRGKGHQQFFSFLHAKNLIALGEEEEGLKIYESANNFFIENDRSKHYRTMVHLGMCELHLKNDELSKARILLDTIQYYSKDQRQVHVEVGHLKLNCEYHYKSENWSALKQELDKIQKLMETNEDLKLKRHFHHYSRLVEKHEGAYDLAMMHSEELNMIKDSVNRRSQMINLYDAEFKYQKAEQDQRIAMLSAENEISNLRLKQQSRRLIASIIGLLLVALLCWWFFHLFQKIKVQNSLIANANDEKDTLLKEIHHRVKNNLQVISALLALQSKYIQDDGALDALKQGQDRVQSMALIHQDLYQTDNLKGVNTKDYFEQLLENLFESYQIGDDQIDLELQVESMMLDVDTMIPLGLLMNELVSNALKHAFTNQEKGRIGVSLARVESQLILKVKDNGKGIVNLDALEGESFGYELIRSFAKKLKADIAYIQEDGFGIELRIKNYQLAA